MARERPGGTRLAGGAAMAGLAVGAQRLVLVGYLGLGVENWLAGGGDPGRPADQSIVGRSYRGCCGSSRSCLGNDRP